MSTDTPSTIHWCDVARAMAEQTGLDYNTVTRPLVEAAIYQAAPALIWLGKHQLVARGSAIYYCQDQVWQTVDTSTPCESCGCSTAGGWCHGCADRRATVGSW